MSGFNPARFKASCLAALIILPLVAGCALTTDTIDVGYTSTSAVTPIPGADRALVGVQTTDSRTGNLRQVSFKKNGYGMEMAPILSSRPVANIVRDALVAELTRAGFKVGAGHVMVSADVVKFRNDFKMGFFSADAIAEASFAVQVVDDGGHILYSRTLSAEGIEGGIQLATGSNAGLALEKALPAVLGRLMSDQAFTRALLAGAAGPDA